MVTNRRQFLSTAGLLPIAGMAGSITSLARGQADREVLPVAAVVTEYRTNSHADVIVGKILEGYQQDGGPGPALRLAAIYTDQTPSGDLSRGLAEKHGFRVAGTIDEALTLGSGQLQVAGVLSIGEHGKYPYTPDTGQHMYPRRRFFDEIAATMRRTGKVAPLFSDKHLAFRWSDAKHMYDTARQMQIPFMAGSSLPVAWREPPHVVPLGSPIEEILAVGYGGLESYGFHALEALQCIAERRRGGETGVAAVQAVRGDAIWNAEQQGRWSRSLLVDALQTTPGGATDGDWEKRLRRDSAVYLLEYRDGLRGTVAMLNGLARHFAVAAKIQGQEKTVATWFKLQDEKPYGHFGYLVRAIDHMVHTRQPAYPVERTLLTTGVLDTVMHSLAQQGQRIPTPQLDVAYETVEWPFANQPDATPG